MDVQRMDTQPIGAQRIEARHRGVVRKANGALRRLCALAVLLCAFAMPSHAAMRLVKPGETPTLAPGDALLLIAVDTDAKIASLRIAREGMNSDMRTLRDIEKGRSSQLYVVSPGRYRWNMLSTAFMRFKLSKDDEYAFEVKPGVLNYPGDLIYRSTNGFFGRTHISNRGLAAMDWLEKQHPGPFLQQRFEYTGHYPDPFPAFYRAALGDKPRTEATRPSPPESGALPIPIDTLWKPGQLQAIEMRPAGDLIAEVLAIKKPKLGKEGAKGASTDSAVEGAESDRWLWALNLIDVRKNEAVRLYETEQPIARIDWVDDRTLAVSIGTDGQPKALIAVAIVDEPNGRRYEQAFVPRPGVVMRTLPHAPGHLLFATVASWGELLVHRLDLRSKAAVARSEFRTGDRLNKAVDEASWWMADAEGRLRLAYLTRKDGDRVLMHGRDKTFSEVLNLDDDDTHFVPIALSADGERIYGLSDEGREQRDLVEFDPATRSIVRTVYSKPGVDISSIRLDDRGELAAATFYQDGLLASAYFDRDSEQLDRSLRAAFPGKAVTLLQRSRDSQQAIVAVSGSDRPMEVYHYDRPQRRAALVSEMQPWLAERTFAPAHTIKAKSKDGFAIEAYLTLPPAKGDAKRPLIVLAHGGPIGVRDDRFFDPEVQFFASLGYAVLQVNFRGSEGFGTAFRKAGERGYGNAIGDDIDAAIVAALAQYPLDATRMCAAGGSYGGYSAMASAIRWPERFRCAISMFGVSDRALFFTASDSGRSEEVRKEMEKLLGDPNVDMDEMKASSPVYRYADLRVPLLLIHGTEDKRVDYEHTRRIARMLDMAGRPPILIELDGEGHGIDDPQNRRKVWSAVAGFLRQHLGDPLAKVPAAPVAGH